MNEFTFTGGVCKNPMATKVLRELVDENYDKETVLNAHADSIYMGALGARALRRRRSRGGPAGNSADVRGEGSEPEPRSRGARDSEEPEST